jgi:hypothetical protein
MMQKYNSKFFQLHKSVKSLFSTTKELNLGKYNSTFIQVHNSDKSFFSQSMSLISMLFKAQPKSHLTDLTFDIMLLTIQSNVKHKRSRGVDWNN